MAARRTSGGPRKSRPSARSSRRPRSGSRGRGGAAAVATARSPGSRGSPSRSGQDRAPCADPWHRRLVATADCRASTPPGDSPGGAFAAFATLPAVRSPNCPRASRWALIPGDMCWFRCAVRGPGEPARVEESESLMSADVLQLIILPAGVIAVLFALYLARDVLSRDAGTKEMQDVAGTIYEGAVAFIRRQYTTIGVLAVVGAVVIGAIITIFETKDVADTSTFGFSLGWRTGLAFLVGAACSMASGIIGMFISVKSNVRTAAAARRSLVEAVQVAMRGGAVSGFLVVALSLLGVYGIFTLFGGLGGGQATHDAPFLIVGFGFGASFVALFAQLGGGIYTKAADVGSDLVGKVEKGIPEDDPRNAGVVADLVGDNVGDCAGRGADLFESTAAENIGAMILGVAVYTIAVASGWPNPEAWIFFPLVVRAFGLLATIVAIFFVRGSETEDPMNMLNRGYWVTTILSVVGLAIVTNVMMNTNGAVGTTFGLPTWVYFFLAGIVGLATSVAFVYITQYYTAGSFRPVREIAEASKTGPATNIISGTAVGFETTAVTAITISIALVLSFWLGSQANLLANGVNV